MQKVIFSRIGVMLTIILGCIIADQEGLFYKLDHTLAELRMGQSARAPSGQIVLLEIDNKSLSAIGTWPWKRSIYAQIIEKSFTAGAEELAFDIDFSASSSASEDQSFEKALAGAQGPVTLAIFQQFQSAARDEARLETNRPIASLEDNAWLATVNMLADYDGVVRHFPLAQEIEGEIYPSLTSVLGGVQDLSAHTFLVDFGIDADAIPTYSVIDLLEGTLPAGALEGRRILVGAGAVELRDTMTVPVFGMLTGPKLQILAAENLLQGRSLAYAPKSWQLGLSVSLFLLLVGLSMGRRLNSFGKILVVLACALAIEAAAFLLYRHAPLILQTGLLQTQLVLSVLAMTMSDMRLKDFLLHLSKRRTESISALLETIVADSFSGILIVDDEERIVKISRRAHFLLAQLGHDARLGALMAHALPPELTLLLRDRLTKPDHATGADGFETLMVGEGEDRCYFECSITPSQVVAAEAVDGDDKSAPKPVVTLLFHDVTKAHLEQQRLAHLADHDALTDVLNKKGFCEQVDEQMVATLQPDALIFACQASRTDTVLQSLGVDFFDYLMCQIAERLTGLDGFDLIGCSNQKEFLLLKLGADKQEIEKLAGEIRACLEAPFEIKGHNILTGCHIGVADFHQGGEIAEEVVKAATMALHRSRETGAVHLLYTKSLAAAVVHRRVLERELFDAIERDEFELYYQPQVNMKTRKIIGCEALIRWNHRDFGIVTPDSFIPILEETGKIADLGRWILRRACHDAMQWPVPISVAVNVSAAQFIRSDVLSDIHQALASSGLPNDRLHVEITESLFIAEPDPIIATLNGIRDAGIQIALDDFGTGYSSLSYIHRFPLSKIKIDRAFVKDLPASMDSIAIINAVIALAHGFELDIVAEGLETEEQLDVLRMAGCQVGQGYLFGKPMPCAAFTELLQQQHNGQQRPVRLVG